MKFYVTMLLRACVVLVLLGLPAPLATAESSDGAPWRMLEFERKSIWGTAKARIELNEKSSAELANAWQNPGRQDYLMPLGESVWELTVAATVGSNRARLQLLMEPTSTAIYQRDRFTVGRKNRRNKFYRYHREGVSRIRRDPQPDEVSLPPAQWSQSLLQEITFPRLPADRVVTAPYALLILTSALPLTADASAAFYVHTDYNLYRVVLQRGIDTRVKASYLLLDSDGQSRRYKEDRRAETIHLQLESTEQAPDKPDFELLGLSGEITVLIDSETRLPLRVIGTAPRVGKAHLDLKSASLAESSAR